MSINVLGAKFAQPHILTVLTSDRSITGCCIMITTSREEWDSDAAESVLGSVYEAQVKSRAIG
jgi:hypothetical protein